METKLREAIREGKVEWVLRKFANEADHKEGKLLDESRIDGNVLLNEGINELWTLVCSSSGTKFDNANAYLGVGDDDTAEAATQTGLNPSGGSGLNELYKAMDGGYPTYGTAQKATWRSTFGAAEANFAWKEFTVANGSSGASVNLNRKVSDQGTKTAGQVWELTLEITLT
jgi:hypothetical protein